MSEVSLADFEKVMAEAQRVMARNIAANIYEPNALGRALLNAHKPPRHYPLREWLADRFITAASWLKGYDVTDND